MPAFAPPEMLRCSLVNLVLKVKMIEPSTEIGGAASGSSLLDECLQPPSLDSVRQSLEQLTYLGATAFDGGVTTLGVVLARMPQLDLRVARLLLIAHAFDCLEDGATIAAALAFHQDVYVQPFVIPRQSEDRAFAKMQTDWDLAQQDIKHFAPKLGRALEWGVQSAPITALRLFQDWAAIRDEEGRDAAKEMAQGEYASAKRLHQLDLLRKDLLRRMQKEGFKKETKLSADAEPFVPGGAMSEEEEETGDRAGGGDGIMIGGGAGAGSSAAKPAAAAALPSEDEVLLKSIITAAFSPNLGVGMVAPQRKWSADGFDRARTVTYKLVRSAPPDAGASGGPPTSTPGVGEDFSINMPALQSAMEQCCYADQPPRVVIKNMGQEHFLVSEFPSEHGAVLGTRLVGLRRQMAIFGGPRAPSGGLPMLCEPVYARRLAFSRPAHKTDMDLESGESRGHMVEMHWQSSCAILHMPATVEDDGASPRRPSQQGDERRYLVATGFQRAGLSRCEKLVHCPSFLVSAGLDTERACRNRLIAMQPTMLPGQPMVAELMLVLFAREVSWLVSTTTADNAFESEIAGAEVGSGDDMTTLIFASALREEDVTKLNQMRASLSNVLGPNLGAGGGVGSASLRTQLFELLLVERPPRSTAPPKPWRRVAAAALADWNSLWSP